MNALLLDFARSVQNTSWGMAIADSFWLYIIVRIIHFAGLSLWIGSIFATDLHSLGFARRGRPAWPLSRRLVPYAWTGFVIAALGGFGMFSSAATTFIINSAFRIKIPLIFIGICYHYFLQTKSKEWGEDGNVPANAKLAFAAELLLWIGIIIAATAIPDV